MKWIIVSEEQYDHATHAADVGDGVLIRHIELGDTSFGTGVVGTSLVYVPRCSVKELLEERAEKEQVPR